MPLFRSLLAECGVAEADQVPWVDALLRARARSDGRASKAPPTYRGLDDPFQEANSGLFSGREEATEELVARIAEARRRGHDKLALVGASGFECPNTGTPVWAHTGNPANVPVIASRRLNLAAAERTRRRHPCSQVRGVYPGTCSCGLRSWTLASGCPLKRPWDQRTSTYPSA